MPIWNGTFCTERGTAELCQERSGTVNLRIPSVMLFQTTCSVRASLAQPDRFRQERTVVCRLPGEEGMECKY